MTFDMTQIVYKFVLVLDVLCIRLGYCYDKVSEDTLWGMYIELCVLNVNNYD